MKIKKLLLATLLVTLFVTIAGMVTCGGFFNWVYKLEPVNVWKPMTGGPAPLYYIVELFLNLIFVFAYSFFSKGILVNNKYLKGLIYGLIVFSVGMLPGMFATYFFQTVNPIVIIYWTIWGAIIKPVQGLITAAVCEE